MVLNVFDDETSIIFRPGVLAVEGIPLNIGFRLKNILDSFRNLKR